MFTHTALKHLHTHLNSVRRKDRTIPLWIALGQAVRPFHRGRRKKVMKRPQHLIWQNQTANIVYTEDTAVNSSWVSGPELWSPRPQPVPRTDLVFSLHGRVRKQMHVGQNARRLETDRYFPTWSPGSHKYFMNALHSQWRRLFQTHVVPFRIHRSYFCTTETVFVQASVTQVKTHSLGFNKSHFLMVTSWC